MRSDEIAFKRATSVSLIGAGFQAAVTVALLLYGVFGQDKAALAATFYALLGLPVWIVLALLYQQHRLERAEAAEAEMYARSSAAQASVFEGAADDLRVAARRLAWMHRWMTPAVSLLIAGGLVAVGWWRVRQARPELIPGQFEAPPLTGWAVAVGLGIAVLAFIFARFVAGMAKQRVWANLRAGAGVAVGVSLAGLAIAVAHGAEFLGFTVPVRYLHTGMGWAMIGLGAEIVLNLVLDLYRPRRAGEIPRPAFDSRILSFVAAPDRIATSISEAINYQVGSDVSSTWFYRLLSRSFAKLVLFGVLVVVALSCFAVVAPNERAIRLRMGRFVGEVESGVVFKAPWPIETVRRYPAERVQEIAAGTPPARTDGPILWTNEHTTGEAFLLVQAGGVGAERDPSSVSLLAIEAPVLYTVGNLRDYLELAADSVDPKDRDKMRRELLTSIAQRETMLHVSALTVDEILAGDRSAMGEALRQRIQGAFDARKAGVRVLFVGVAAAHPPQRDEVALSFERVVSADILKATAIERAQARAIRSLAEVAGDVALANRIVGELDGLERLRAQGGAETAETAQEQGIEALLDEAGGSAAGEILQARADRWKKAMRFRAEALRQQGRLASFRAAPSVYTARLYFEALAGALEGVRLFITAVEDPRIRFDLTEVQPVGGFDIQSATRE